jgi:pSer/pThr/pTyr-binding forkhead associated (FHA) protein/anti-anti-sigma regulatory factor
MRLSIPLDNRAKIVNTVRVKLKVAVRSPEGEVRTLEFEKTAVSIGRGAKNDLVVQDTAVSQSHATIIHNPRRGIYELVDVGSTNGTFMDGRRIETSVPIDRPRIVILGSHQLLIYPPEEDADKGTVVMDLRQAQGKLKDAMIETAMYAPDEDETLDFQAMRAGSSRRPVEEAPAASGGTQTRKPSAPVSAPLVTLEFVDGQYAGKTIGKSVGKDGLVFGRDVANQVIFKDPHISRGHFAVYAGEKGFYLANLKPDNPVDVDGRSVTHDSVWLHNGSRVACHRECFHVRWEEKTPPRDGGRPPEAAPAPETAPGELGVVESALAYGFRKYLLTGDVNIGNYYKLENLLLANLSPVQKWALVDMTKVRTLDYPALASLIKVLAEYTKIKGLIAFTGVSPALVQIFQLVNVDRYLRKFVYADEHEAVGALLASRKG